MAKKNRGLQGSMYDAVQQQEPKNLNREPSAEKGKRRDWLTILGMFLVFAVITGVLGERYITDPYHTPTPLNTSTVVDIEDIEGYSLEVLPSREDGVSCGVNLLVVECS